MRKSLSKIADEPPCSRIILLRGNYSPPFWEILLDTVTAESPTGEG
jgi:hypothetical protein